MNNNIINVCLNIQLRRFYSKLLFEKYFNILKYVSGSHNFITEKMIENLSKQGVDILSTDDSTIRAVFHLHITDEDLENAIGAFSKI